MDNDLVKLGKDENYFFSDKQGQGGDEGDNEKSWPTRAVNIVFCGNTFYEEITAAFV